MKASCLALTCLLSVSVPVLSVNLRGGDLDDKQPTAHNLCNCPGNRFPLNCADTYTAAGLKKWSNLFQVEGLRTEDGHEITNTPWKTSRKWTLKVTVSSKDPLYRDFGFGGAGDGFLKLTIAPGLENVTLNVSDIIRGTADDVFFEYRGLSDKNTKSRLSGLNEAVQEIVADINFTNICLRPMICGEYTCSNYDRMTLTPNFAQPGSSDNECCTDVFCNTFSCAPATQWTAKPNAATIKGRTHDLCCAPIYCKDQAGLCTGDAQMPVAGTGILGNTAAECCEEARCLQRGCSDPTKYKLKPTITLETVGSTDAVCCDPITCDGYRCQNASMHLKPNHSNISGSTDKDCCEEAFCKDWTCSDLTKWKPQNITAASATDPNFRGNITGGGDERCCIPKKCSDHQCPANMQPQPGASSKLGSSDAQCCELKLCEKYECSDKTKYIKASHFVGSQNDLPRRGHTDAECCIPLKCEDFFCSPSTQWTLKPAAELVGLLGSSNEVCCNPVHCDAYDCSSATKWYKKIDTNSFKWPGSTDEECCEPKYCTQYYTEYPTKWKRKAFVNGTIIPNLKGSTDVECYDPVFCSEYGCVEPMNILVTNAGRLRGSTDKECCVKNPRRGPPVIDPHR